MSWCLGVFVAITIKNDTGRNDGFYRKLRRKIDTWLKKKEGSGNRWVEVLMTAPDLFYLLWKLSIDSEVPAKSRGILAAAVVYFISPIDLFPEAVFGPVGYLDDIALTAYVLNRIINDTPPQLVKQYWAGEHDVLIIIKNILINADLFLGRGLWNRVKKMIG